MRHLFTLLIVGFCSTLALADDVATYTVQDGAAPWSDRVGAWELGDIPAGLKSSQPIPQQQCAARSLTITGKPKSITVGVSDAESAAFKTKYPTAKETGDKFIIRHPKETTGLPYSAMTLPDPTETISGGDTPFGAGLVLLKVDTADATTAPATAPATKP